MAGNCHSGHPLKWFKDQNAARQAFECAICLEVLEDPVQVRDCGHQFCALCIDDILKTDPRCPSCRIEISKSMVFEDHAARRLINQLEVNCCNEGCSWQGCLSSLLQDHQNSCNFLIRSGENVRHLDVGKLEQQLQTLMVRVSTLEKLEQDVKVLKELKVKHEEDIKELNLKHEEDIKELKLKHENELKAVKAKYQNDLKQVQAVQENKFKQFKTKYDNELKDLKQVQSTRENELQQIKTKHAENLRLLGQKIEVLQAIGAAHAPLATQFPQRSLPQQEPEADYTLKIANFTRKLAQAISDKDYGIIESEPFFSSHGYKMKLLVYLNLAPSGYAGYMGVYIALMKSDRDGTLAWPFTKRFTFVLVDQQDDLSQRENIKYAIVPCGEELFGRPRQRENDGLGQQQFVKHSTLRTRQYVRDHTVYIKFLVDP